MKKITLILLVLLSIHWVCIAQTDSLLVSLPNVSKTYKNNIKVGLPLLITRYTIVNLAYQRALSRKSSLSINLQYYIDPRKLGYSKFGIMPSYNFFLSKFKNGMYNRGFYLHMSALVEYYTNKNFIDKGFKGSAVGGIGYQWVIGKRVTIDIMGIIVRNIIVLERISYSPSQISDWQISNYGSGFAIVQPKVMIGYAF